jgi:UDPglucose 6-dehydrogenase
MDKLSLVGLGRLGLPMAACFAVKGFETIGVDVDENVVKSINDGISPIIETRLQEFISKAGNKLKATQNYEEAINETDVTFIMVSTPSNPDGSFSNGYIESALKSLAECFKKVNKKYHLFVISSTVMPGSTEERFIPLIEQCSGKKMNVDFGVCYDPDFAALGSVIKDFLNPDFVVIGESNKFAGDQVSSIHRRLCENKPRIFQMSIINAEITKVSVNCYVTMKISFANALANICERILGADVDSITQALGADRRISPHYLRGGLSYGGTCFPRDTRAYIALAKKYDYHEELMAAVDKVNKIQDQHLAEITLNNISRTSDKRVSILGLSFKPNTPVIVESPAIKLINALLKRGIKIIVYDPLAMENTRAVFGNRINYADSARACVSQASLCIITTPLDEFRHIDNSYIANNPTVIIDCWRILDSSKFAKSVKYIALGRAGL